MIQGRTRLLKFDDCAVLHDSNMEEPCVSVIVPVYNEGRGGFLQECLRSLMDQFLAPMELIFIDDASVDDTLDILLAAAERSSNVSVLRMKENSKQGAARNRGIAFARGRYIGFMDADDVVDRDYYDALYREAVKSGADMIEAPLRRIDVSGAVVSEAMLAFKQADLGLLDDEGRKRLIGNTPMGVQCILKSSFLKNAEHAFPEGMVYEDTPTMVRWVYDLASISQVDGTNYYYRFNPHSTCNTTTKSKRSIEDRMRSSDMLISDAKERGVYERYEEAIDAYYFRVCGWITLGMLCSEKDPPDEDCCKMVTDHVVDHLGEAKVRALLSSSRHPWYEWLVLNLLWRDPSLYYKLSKFKRRMSGQ